MRQISLGLLAVAIKTPPRPLFIIAGLTLVSIWLRQHGDDTIATQAAMSRMLTSDSITTSILPAANR